jgi:hypothetical protein
MSYVNAITTSMAPLILLSHCLGISDSGLETSHFGVTTVTPIRVRSWPTAAAERYISKAQSTSSPIAGHPAEHRTAYTTKYARKRYGAFSAKFHILQLIMCFWGIVSPTKVQRWARWLTWTIVKLSTLMTTQPASSLFWIWQNASSTASDKRV